MLIQHRAHDRALAAKREFQIPEEPADVRTLVRVAEAGDRINGGATEVRTKHRIAAREIAQIEAHVHGMRVPGEKDDGLFRASGALDLGEHALLTGFDELEPSQPELVLLQHAQDEPVAVIAGLDAVNRILQLRAEALYVGEVVQAECIGCRREPPG